MIRNTIPGLNKIFENDIYPGSIVLVTGTPGTLKSGLTFNIMSEHLKGRDESGIYFTLEESEESHTRNMRSLGLNLPKNLTIVDYTHIRRRIKEGSKKINIIGTIESAIKYFHEEIDGKYTCFALDSLGALYSLYEDDPDKMNGEIYHFFEMLRDMQMTAFIIMERSRFGIDALAFGGHESFLADGIIEMGTIEAHQDINLYMQVVKMRGCAHSRKKFLIEVGERGLSILGPVLGD